MSDVLVVIDMQNDFLTGVFGSEYAASVIKPISGYAREFNGDVFFTKDTHYEDTFSNSLEGQAFPLHCAKGTEGHEICRELADLANENNTIEKAGFGSVDLVEVVKDYDNVYLVGVCTDICVISNALLLRAHYPNKKIHVVDRLCRGLNETNHKAAITVLYSCLIEVI